MKDRGIVMTADSVRAILDDRKTQSRRLIRIDNLPVMVKVGDSNPSAPADGAAQDLVSKGQRLQRGIPSNATNVRFLGPYLKCDAPPGSNTVSSRVPCPYGEIGTRLYIKESWAQPGTVAGSDDPVRPDGRVVYCADTDVRHSWRSPRFMPKWAARIWLELTEVRVQRLQAITEEDAKAEGIAQDANGWWNYGGEAGYCTARMAFVDLWDLINYERAPWAVDPWCWCLSFRRVETPAHV